MLPHLRILAYLTILSRHSDIFLTVAAQGFNFPDSPNPDAPPATGVDGSIPPSGLDGEYETFEIPCERCDRNNESSFYRKTSYNTNNFTRFSFATSICSNGWCFDSIGECSHPNNWSNLYLCSNRTMYTDDWYTWWIRIDRYSNCNSKWKKAPPFGYTKFNSLHCSQLQTQVLPQYQLHP